MAKLLFNPSEHPDVTFDDLFMLPNNNVEKKVMEVATDDERKAIIDARRKFLMIDDTDEPIETTGAEINFGEYQTYRATLMRIAEAHGVGKAFSRDDVCLEPAGSLAHTPTIIANMNNVTGKRMAEAIARVGGIAAIPQDKSDEELTGIIAYLRSRHPLYETPVTITEKAKIHEFKKLLHKRSHNMAVVVDAESAMVGVLSEADIPNGLNNDTEVRSYVRRDNIVTAKDGIGPIEAIETMTAQHVNYLPILNGGRQVVGVLPLMDAAMRLRYTPNLDTRNGGLRALYTIGAFNKNPIDRVKFLLDNGVYDLLLDTANFDQGIMSYRNLERVLHVAANRKVEINLMAGNMVTREAVRNALAAGAQFVKIGVGPGAMCTTRMQTGVGRPQISAVLECAEEAHKYGGYAVADGGVQHPRDYALAMAAGADYVMVGSLFAGTYESPSDLEGDQKNGYYKINYGMASARASMLRTFGREKRAGMDVFRSIVGHRSEGISESKVYLKPGRESAALLQHDLLDGTASSAAYANALSLQAFSAEAVMGIQTSSGYKEGTAKEKF